MSGRSVDLRLLSVVLAMTVLGMVMISSVSVYPSNKITSMMVKLGRLDEPNNYFYLLRNMAHVAIGFTVLGIVSRTPYRWFERHAKRIFFLAVGLLLVVLLFGQTYNGAKGWLSVPFLPFLLQPAEFLKIGAILYLSYFLKRRRQDMGDLHRGFLPFLAAMGAFVLPLALQPDFGTILIVAPVGVLLYFLGGGNAKYLAVFAAACAILGGGAYLMGKHHGPDDRTKLSYITDRIDNFFSSNREAIKAKTINYQTEQGLIAIGSGGFWGLGFGKSVQKYGYLPEAEGDFIFSIAAEELGFVGVCAIVGAILFLTWRGLEIARRAEDPFARYVAAGVTAWIFLQSFVNIGVNLNVVPLTGMTLPFISYGGSSLVALMVAVGILLNISREAPAAVSYHARRLG